MKNEMHTSYAGIYVFEGIDNVGKTSIIQKLKVKLIDTTGCNCIDIAFHGNEPRTLGRLVYDIHHHSDTYFDTQIGDASLQLLHVAAHVDLIGRKLTKDCCSSTIILLDRFWWSTYAYGLAGSLEKNVVQDIIASEKIYWENIDIKKIFLIEREIREKDYDENKDAAIVGYYKELCDSDSRCQIINNDCKLDKTVVEIYDTIVGESTL